MDSQIIEKLLKINEQTKVLGKKFTKKRFLFDRLVRAKTTKIITGVSGLRGSGKTVLLAQLLNNLEGSFYITGDIPINNSFYHLVEFLIKNYRIRYLLIDEIHQQKKWPEELKLIYDYLPIKLYFTSSVSLNILNLKQDLTRRLLVFDLPIFSFREYLNFKSQINISSLKLTEILKNPQKLFQELHPYEVYFRDYLSQPLPFLLENNLPELIKQIALKIIEKDIYYAAKFSSVDIEMLKNIIIFIANIPVSETNYSSLSRNLGITKYKVKNYVDVLEKGYLLKPVFPYSSSVIKEPKINLLVPFRQVFNQRLNEEQLLGAIKEEFFVQMLISAGYHLAYLKSKRGVKTPDYLLSLDKQKFIFEIGGRKKGFTQFKGIDQKYKKLIVTYPGINQKNKIALFLFGFLY